MQHNTRYIVLFACAVCAVCSIFVSTAAVGLRARQDANKLLDRQTNVLDVSGLIEPGEKIPAEEVRRLFAEAIQPVAINLATGEVAHSVDAASFDQRAAAKDADRSQEAPPNAAKVRRIPNHALLYEVNRGQGVEVIILPIEGYGLWSTLYGYIALSADLETIRGITFYEHGETAGLGGEVDNRGWKARWVGRKAFNDRWVPKISVKKGVAGSVEDDPYQVDGLSGATITSRGVTELVRFWLGDNAFGPYLERYRSERRIQ